MGTLSLTQWTASLICFALLIFHKLCHQQIKQLLFPLFEKNKNISGEKNIDHVVAIFVQSIHIMWISIVSLILTALYYRQRASNYLTMFPTWFLVSVYISEFYLRKMDGPIIAHHFAFLTLFALCCATNSWAQFNCFNILEFGHAFHFVPYLLYKFAYPLETVYQWNQIAIYGFLVVRIVGFAAVSLFVLLTNFDLLFGQHPVFITTAILFVGVLFLLQFHFYRDVLNARNITKHKRKTQIEKQTTPQNTNEHV